jgi:hypothetical protein
MTLIVCGDGLYYVLKITEKRIYVERIRTHTRWLPFPSPNGSNQAGWWFERQYVKTLPTVETEADYDSIVSTWEQHQDSIRQAKDALALAEKAMKDAIMPMATMKEVGV